MIENNISTGQVFDEGVLGNVEIPLVEQIYLPPEIGCEIFKHNRKLALYVNKFYHYDYLKYLAKKFREISRNELYICQTRAFRKILRFYEDDYIIKFYDNNVPSGKYNGIEYNDKLYYSILDFLNIKNIDNSCTTLIINNKTITVNNLIMIKYYDSKIVIVASSNVIVIQYN